MYYTASLFFRSEHTPKSENPLWEERLVLIEALSEEEAIKRAEEVGQHEQHEYKNERGDLVRWRFIKVERTFLLEKDELKPGVELFSRFLGNIEAESILKPLSE